IVRALLLWFITPLMEGENRESSTDEGGRNPELAAAGASTADEETAEIYVCSSTSSSASPPPPSATAATASASSTPAATAAPAASAAEIVATVTTATTTTTAPPTIATAVAAAAADIAVDISSAASNPVLGVKEDEGEQVTAAKEDGGTTCTKEKDKEDGTEAVEVEEAPSAVPPSQTDELRKALVGFYSVHNPGRIANLDAILTQYAGKEGLLIERLEHKYSADLSYARRAPATAPITPEGGMPPPVPDDHKPLTARSQHQQQKPQEPRPTSSAARVGAAAPALPQSLSSQPSIAPAPRPTREALSAHGGGGGGGGGVALSRSPGSVDTADSNRPGFSRTASGTAQQNGVGPSTSNYMTYLADQIRSNVEGLLPASNSGGGGSGVARGGGSPNSVSHVPNTATTGGKKQLPAEVEARGGRGAGTYTGAGDGSSIDTSGHYQYTSGEVDHTLTARVRTLEEERGGLVAACRRMQAKAEAASREAAAAEELREAGQRKVSGFAERAMAAERRARGATARVRTLEYGQSALQAEKEASDRRCAVKHAQLLSAIDLQMSLRSQLEGLLEVVPPSPLSGPSPKANGSGSLPRQEAAGSAVTVPADSRVASLERPPDPASDEVAPAGSAPAGGRESGGDDEKGGGGGGGGGLNEIRRRCSMLEVSLRASRREALEARRSRDSAETTVRQQSGALAKLQERVSALEASLAKEQEAGKGASQAASGLEAELELRLGQLRKAEADLSDQADANSRLTEELRGALARLGIASTARAALVDFCRQERESVEMLAAERVALAEESAGMRGEDGLARGLELARMAEELGDKRAAGLELEVDRLGKALFASRAELAGSEARVQGLRRELERAAETIVGLSRSAIASSSIAVGEGAAVLSPQRAGGPAAAAGTGGKGGGTRISSRGDSSGSLREAQPSLLMRTPEGSASFKVIEDCGSGGGMGAGVPAGVGGGGSIRSRSPPTGAFSAAGRPAPKAPESNTSMGLPDSRDVSSAIAAAAAATREVVGVSASGETGRHRIRNRSPRYGGQQKQQQQTELDVEL
ncbi:unnamed protein product, partial [Ectocarpus sp. 6 AP-2014]